MKLIGKFDSLYVRRVAISLDHFGLHYEHLDWSVGPDLLRILEVSPLGRVPVLVLDDGEVLVDSAAILDHLDECVGPARTLLPTSGAVRRETLRIIAYALGAAEKGAAVVYESLRPPPRRDESWSSRWRAQMQGALERVEAACVRRAGYKWLIGERMTQADITAACVCTFLRESGALEQAEHYPALAVHTARCEALPLFQDNHLRWSAFRR